MLFVFNIQYLQSMIDFILLVSLLTALHYSVHSVVSLNILYGYHSNECYPSIKVSFLKCK